MQHARPSAGLLRKGTMSQYGMQMPGGTMQRGPTMNIYTGLLFLAVVALLAACGFVFVQGGKIAPGGNALSTHAYNETTKSYDVKFVDGK